jgi:hypothetical protein
MSRHAIFPIAIHASAAKNVGGFDPKIKSPLIEHTPLSSTQINHFGCLTKNKKAFFRATAPDRRSTAYMGICRSNLDPASPHRTINGWYYVYNKFVYKAPSAIFITPA